ncbi:type II and III secretion system protein family protein [Herbaspirillum sp. ST 5-3]|uniref:type II and III secretion system protein family protein n=1 Tax=Oxalobacteraceae TaxID=75682 RepID=UPI001FFECF06|nr:type II and III secretion system protein family protein [Herbaspirillum sp. ST 5-3]
MKNNTKPASHAIDRFCPCLLTVATLLALGLPPAAQAQSKKDEASATSKEVVTKAVAKPGDKKAVKSGTAPAPLATPTCVDELAPTAYMSVPAAKSALLDLRQLNLPSPAWLRTVGDPDIVQVEPMTSPTPRAMFFLFGKQIGSTNLMFQNKEGRCAMVEVAVGVDTASVEAKLRQLLPAEKNIKVGAVADSLVLSGTVADALAVENAISIASAFVRKGGGKGAAGSTSDERIVNMLAVAAPQQVMLEVKVAEISKTLLDKLGVNLSGTLHRGDWTASLLSNFLSDGAGKLNITKSPNGDSVTVDAEKKDGLVKVLAEPTVMAVSGQEGSFLAGGKIFIPVYSTTSGVNPVNTITLEEREFGVSLRFTPTVLDGGRINLKVAPEVSELSREGAGISSLGTTSILPLFTTRRAATTVQLHDGQSFAIGGLIKNNVTENIKAFPFLGEVPVLGALFRSSEFQNDRTELVFVVTPRLVKPLAPNYPLPTDGFVPPSRGEFFLGGKLEGSAPAKPAQQSAAPAASSSGGPSGFELK